MITVEAVRACLPFVTIPKVAILTTIHVADNATGIVATIRASPGGRVVVWKGIVLGPIVGFELVLEISLAGRLESMVVLGTVESLNVFLLRDFHLEQDANVGSVKVRAYLSSKGARRDHGQRTVSWSCHS